MDRIILLRDNVKEIIISANSYLQYKNTLYLVTQGYRKYPITILTPNHDLFRFFSVINEKVFNGEITLIYFDNFQPDPRRKTARDLSKIFYILRDIIRERRYLKDTFKKYLAGITGSDFFFFGRGSTCFFLVKSLVGRNRAVYLSSYPIAAAPKQYAPTNIAELTRLIILKLTFGWGIALGKVAHVNGVPHIPDWFLKKKVDRVIGEEERDEMLKGFELDQFKVFDTAKYSAMYLDDNLINSGHILDKDTFRKEIGEVVGILTKYFPSNEIARKYHPDYSSDRTVIEVGDILPDFIPAELLYHDKVKLYLGDSTTAIANVEKGLAISILNLISFKNAEIREQLKEVLIRMSRSKLLFPRTLGEFEEILISLFSNKKENSDQ